MAKRTTNRKAPRRPAPQKPSKQDPDPLPKDPAPSPAFEPEAEDPEESEEGVFPIVGIGASAGGLEAFTEMLQVLRDDTGMGFVFVQHLDPKHVSMLTELLQRHTKMPVQDATEGMRVEPNHIYVIPRNKHMGLKRGVLTLSPRLDSPMPHMPIDPFLRSLGADQKGKSIGVILSGNASDGALGMMAIKAAGGITFAQDSESAKYDGMPRAAVASGCIDFVLPPREISKELARLGQHPYISPLPSKGQEEPSPVTQEAIVRILGLLRSATGVDFAYYKPNTIRRRILRRMALRQVDNPDRYITRLRSDPAELQALYDDILINVTEFFRDPDVFEQLKSSVFPKIAPPGHSPSPIRVWVPGCASGEEVYSIAIALLEYLGERSHEVSVQIFGTDISDAALEKARSGTYAPSVVQDVSAERIRRFFTKVDSSYQISKRIREMCVFAKQNLIKDPPFSKLDFVSCRNVLIYLGPVLQKRVVPIFHYALKPNGYLLLGSSETIGGFSELFTLEDKKAKIYRRRAAASRPAIEFPVEQTETVSVPVRAQAGDWSEVELQKEGDRIVLGKYSPAAVVVDSDLNVVQFRGGMSPFLEPAAGMATLNLLKLAREGLSVELRNAFHKAQRENAPVRREGLHIRRNGGTIQISMEVIPFKKVAGRDPRFMILLEEMASTPPIKIKPDARTKKDGKRKTDSEASQLRQELVATKEYLQSVIEELESSNEELRSANEEIQSSNEELQSTNEELETAKEELQSSNEELNTVNEELQTRNLQLAQAGNDLMNLLGNVNIPIIMLGNDLRIRRFTPVSQRLLNLIPSDVGRPISDINLNLDIKKLDRLVAEVIDTLTARTFDVRDLGGRPYSLRIRPYRTEDNKIDGAVIVLVDLDSSRSTIEAAAEKAMADGGVTPKTAKELRAFGTGLLVAQENERRNLALELHDDLSQRLALLELTVGTLEKNHPSADQREEQLRSVQQQLTSLGTSLRQIAYRLHPAALDQLGLAQAVESYVREFGDREGIQVRFQANNLPGIIDSQEALSLYRIVQEGLRNIAQHASAKTAEVLLSRTDHRIQLRIKDSGSGFNLEEAKEKTGLGLRSMEERARACGGTFKITSQPGSGTEIVVEVPEQRTQT
ncbi:MAG: chemotaxis protein CheR [Acidobacteria bacterium]|nr:MAG: chemotaxis protein CheR [Acidobacteriota bacterium]